MYNGFYIIIIILYINTRLGFVSFFVALSQLKKFLTHRHKANFDLNAEIMKMMFDGDTMLPVSSDAGLFTLVMSTFNQYEKMVCIQFVSDR